MPPLSQEQSTEFSRILKSRYRELWGDVQRELANAQPYSDIAGETHDLEDQATADVLVDINLADIHRDIGEMRDIESALERIIERSYGTCSDCGGDIGLDRLRAWPTAKRCQPCQGLHERQYATPKHASM